MSTFPVRAPAPFEPSDPRQLGDYELLGRLGSGGMGVVFLGRRASDGELVAVKIYHAHLDERYKLSERFRREALAATRVPRQCTAPVLEVALDEKIPYIVTAYVPGLTLAEHVSTYGPLAADDLDAVAVGLAKALAAVHEVGVIHRDLTPRNVILSPYGPRIIDFGVAVADDAAHDLTQVAGGWGSRFFAAPEQILGRSATSASDVFAWAGVTTYAGTGRQAFGTGDGLTERILQQAPDLTGLRPPLRRLVAAALFKDPEDRPTADELVDQLTGGRAAAPVTTWVLQTAAVPAAERDAAAPPPPAGSVFTTVRAHTQVQTRSVPPTRAQGAPAPAPTGGATPPPPSPLTAAPPLSVRTKGTFNTPARRRYLAAARAETRGNAQRAAVLYRKAALSPERYWPGAASIALGNLMRREGLPDAAREAYEAGATARMPELRALSRINLARLHLAAGRRADAVQAYRAAEATGHPVYAPAAAQERAYVEGGRWEEVASGRVEVPSVRPPAAVAALVPLTVVLTVLGPSFGGGSLLAAAVCGLGVIQVRRAGAALTGRTVFIGLCVVNLALALAHVFGTGA